MKVLKLLEEILASLEMYWITRYDSLSDTSFGFVLEACDDTYTQTVSSVMSQILVLASNHLAVYYSDALTRALNSFITTVEQAREVFKCIIKEWWPVASECDLYFFFFLLSKNYAMQENLISMVVEYISLASSLLSL